MPNPDHVKRLKTGYVAWNQWRSSHPDIVPDLSEADLEKQQLRRFDFRGANLRRVSLRKAFLRYSDLTGADLSDANIRCAVLNQAIIRHANLRGADLSRSILRNTDLSGADLTGASLRYCSIVEAELTNADLTGCAVYGAAAWNNIGIPISQRDLLINKHGEAAITVDNLAVAQFLFLLTNNRQIRHVIDTITSKVVLILGRFTPNRKAILDAIRDELRKRDYVPVLFDFEKPSNRDITETVSTLAHMARFVIADITDAKSIPQELMQIVPFLPSVPVQTLLMVSQREYGMFEHFTRYPWVLGPFLYQDQDHLIRSLDSHVLEPAEAKAKEQTG